MASSTLHPVIAELVSSAQHGHDLAVTGRVEVGRDELEALDLEALDQVAGGLWRWNDQGQLVIGTQGYSHANGQGGQTTWGTFEVTPQNLWSSSGNVLNSSVMTATTATSSPPTNTTRPAETMARARSERGPRFVTGRPR